MRRYHIIIAAITLTIFGICYFAYDTERKTRIPYVIEECKNILQSVMKSPSSFKLVSADCLIINDQPILIIEYDSSNSFGAIIRGEAVFTFKPDTEHDIYNNQPKMFADRALGLSIFDVSIVDKIELGDSVYRDDNVTRIFNNSFPTMDMLYKKNITLFEKYIIENVDYEYTPLTYTWKGWKKYILPKLTFKDEVFKYEEKPLLERVFERITKN